MEVDEKAIWIARRLLGFIALRELLSVIPVEVNSKIEFLINLKTAKALEVTIAPEVLYQANRLIR